MIPKLFYYYSLSLSMTFSQIWLCPLVDDCQSNLTPPTSENLKKRTLIYLVMIGSEFLRNLQLTSSTEYTIIVNVSNVRLIGSGFDFLLRAFPAVLSTCPCKKDISYMQVQLFTFFSFLPTPPIKLKLGLQIGGRVLVPPHIKLKLGLQIGGRVYQYHP